MTTDSNLDYLLRSLDPLTEELDQTNERRRADVWAADGQLIDWPVAEYGSVLMKKSLHSSKRSISTLECTDSRHLERSSLKSIISVGIPRREIVRRPLSSYPSARETRSDDSLSKNPPLSASTAPNVSNAKWRIAERISLPIPLP